MMNVLFTSEGGDRRKGISLVEILVVVVILLILAALLFPIFRSAKRSAKSASCASNLHQIGLATQMYARDNDDGTPATMSLWAPFKKKLIDPLLDYGMTTNLYHCPDFSGKRAGDWECDYSMRFVLPIQPSGSTQLPTIWKIDPESNSVIAYCTWNTLNPRFSPGDGVANGSINALRYSGSVQRIPTERVTMHREAWAGFGSDVDPSMYQWAEFPNEPFPPPIRKLP